MKFSIVVACVCLVLTVPSGFGQSSLWGVTGFTSPGPAPGEFTISYTVSPPKIKRTILKGRPYSGEEVSQQTKIFSDGTRAVQQLPSTITYRDVAGRIRTERHTARPLGAVSWVESPVVPEIIDPVAGYIYYLDPVNRIAHRMLLPDDSIQIITNPPNMDYPASVTKDYDAVRSYEPLAKTVIDGIEVLGRRITTTYAAGLLGNDRPIVAITEIWTSPDLGLAILSKNTDPRLGEFTNAVINISRAQPDPALFQAPPDYAIVDEPKVPFTFTISMKDAAKQLPSLR
jgi:hypothetical protein